MTNKETTISAISAKIRHLRRLANLTQNELGEKIGVSGQQIQKYETGHDNLAVDRLYQIASVLEVHPIELLPPIKKTLAGDLDFVSLIGGLAQIKKQDIIYLIKFCEIFTDAKTSQKDKERIMEALQAFFGVGK
jgi:transcriptional regulator with XRE-family HTH domain